MTLALSPNRIRRPVLRYQGGKYRLSSHLLKLFPKHRIYVEPYGGAASVLMQKSRSYAEVYNDIDREIVNVFRVMQDPGMAGLLERKLLYTPFARDEFHLAYDRSDDPIEQARRTVIKSFMGFGTDAIHRPRQGMRTRASVWPVTGFRSDSNKSGTTPAHDWQNYPHHIASFCARLAGVVIENRNALEVIKTHDRLDTLFYVDPPYPHSVRGKRIHKYAQELTDDEHRALSVTLHAVVGMVVVSSYPSDLYESLYADWRKTRWTGAHFCDGARTRTECVWLNPNAVENSQRKLW